MNSFRRRWSISGRGSTAPDRPSRQLRSGCRRRGAGVPLPPPKKGKTSEKTRRSAERAYEKGQSHQESKTNPRRSKAISGVLKHEGHGAASKQALARQAKQQSRKRTAGERSAIGRKAARTRLAHQTHAERVAIAREAARTRAAHRS